MLHPGESRQYAPVIFGMGLRDALQIVRRPIYRRGKAAEDVESRQLPGRNRRWRW